MESEYLPWANAAASSRINNRIGTSPLHQELRFCDSTRYGIRNKSAFSRGCTYNQSMFALLLTAAIIAGIALWSLLLWALVRFVFAALSGWNQLAQRFPAPALPQAWHWYGETVKVGSVRYRRCMKVAALPDGLYLAASGLLRHPPLRIPWTQMVSAAPSSFYGRPAVAVQVGAPVVATLEFPAELYQAIYTSAPRR